LILDVFGFSLDFGMVFFVFLGKRMPQDFMVSPVLRDIKDIHCFLPFGVKLCSINEVMRGSRIGRLAGQRQRKSRSLANCTFPLDVVGCRCGGIRVRMARALKLMRPKVDGIAC
jgi:hypothetical protein